MIKQVEFEIINQVAETLANNNESGVLDMLQKSKRQDLMNIYTLYSRVETNPSDNQSCLNYICSRFQVYIQQEGNKYVQEVE